MQLDSLAPKGYLPNRQLRNKSKKCRDGINCYLPNRQLRKKVGIQCD